MAERHFCDWPECGEECGKRLQVTLAEQGIDLTAPPEARHVVRQQVLDFCEVHFAALKKWIRTGGAKEGGNGEGE